MITLKEWQTHERAETLFRANPCRYRLRLALLFAEGALAALLLFALVGWLVAVFLSAPRAHIRLGLFLLFNLIWSVVAYRHILATAHDDDRILLDLAETDWPLLHAWVRETAAAVGAPPVHAIRLAPFDFNASVSSAASLRRNDLVIGYPLLAALSACAFRALLVHELAHVAHRDTLRLGAILRLKAFWYSVNFGLFTLPFLLWRDFFLLRLDLALSPIERECERAADCAVAQTLGTDALRELLVAMHLRAPDIDADAVLRPLVRNPSPSSSPSPAAAIRDAMRRPLPPDLARRRLERDLRSIVLPTEEHPPLAERAGTADPADLLPYADAPRDALETLFGSPSALDTLLDEACRPVLDTLARSDRFWQDRLAALETLPPSSSTAYWRIDALRALGRTEEADRAQLQALADWPGNAAIESRPRLDALLAAGSAEEAAPAAARLETLLEAEPMLRDDVAAPLLAHYLEIGDAARAKALLATLRRQEKRYSRRTRAKLRPSDDLLPMPMGENERAGIAAMFAGTPIREIYPVWRRYGDTAATTAFFVVRWRLLADATNLLPSLNEALGGEIVAVTGTRALYRRLAKLGVLPIPVPQKAPPDDEASPPPSPPDPPQPQPQPQNPEGTPP